MSSKRKYTDAEFITAVKRSVSFGQVFKLLNIAPTGGHYAIAKQMVKQLNLDISHFKGKAWAAGRHIPCKSCLKIPLDKILVKDSSYHNTTYLRDRLFRDKIKKRICENCGITEWLGKPVALQLHHINGDRTDHRLENLQIVCPNCHAQTKTYCGKQNKLPQVPCARCHKMIKHNKKYCSHLCANQDKKYTHKTKIVWPSKEKVKYLVNKEGYSAVGRRLGVSDNAIRKFLNKPQ